MEPPYPAKWKCMSTCQREKAGERTKLAIRSTPAGSGWFAIFGNLRLPTTSPLAPCSSCNTVWPMNWFAMSTCVYEKKGASPCVWKEQASNAKTNPFFDSLSVDFQLEVESSWFDSSRGEDSLYPCHVGVCIGHWRSSNGEDSLYPCHVGGCKDPILANRRLGPHVILGSKHPTIP